MYTFGPVPSYSRVYCQVGRTTKMLERKAFYDPQEVVKEVIKRLKGTSVDVVTIVPEGEPTLDVNLGKPIRRIKKHAKVAVITNGSLLFREDVKQDG